MGFDIKVPTYDLDGKVAVVTGAGRGIGLAVAKTLAGVGAKVVITDLEQPICEEAARQITEQGGTAMGVAANAAKIADMEALVEQVVDRYGQIDILVNNAGVTVSEKPIFEVTEKEWDFVQDIDVKGLYFTSQVIAKQMMKQGNGGRIVNLGSAAGIMSPKYVSVYGTAKAGVIHMTSIMAQEWARWGINVNAVAPGYIITDMTREMLENEKNASAVLKSIPFRRYGQVSDVANVILFLVSEASNYLTGVLIPIDGGMTA